MKEGGHLRLFNYLETSGKSDEGLHDMIYFAFSKMTALGTITITRSDLVRAVPGEDVMPRSARSASSPSLDHSASFLSLLIAASRREQGGA